MNELLRDTARQSRARTLLFVAVVAAVLCGAIAALQGIRREREIQAVEAATIAGEGAVESPVVPESPGASAALRGGSRSAAGAARVEEPKAPSASLAADPSAQDLRVLTVDSEGLPLGEVPVELFMRNRYDGTEQGNLFAAVSRAPDGIANMDGSKDTVWHLLRRPEMSTYEAGVRCTLPFDEPVEALLESPNGEGEPIRLVIPPSGWIEVETRPGASMSEPAPVVERIQWRRILPNGVSAAFEARGCSVRIGPVGLGWSLRLDAFSPRRTDPVGSLRFEGPNRPGEILHAVIETTGSLRIEGVALDALGQPLRDINMIAIVVLREGGTQSYARTDSAGRFSVEIAAGSLVDALDLRRCDIPQPAPRARVAITSLPVDTHRILDVGDVTLRLKEDEGRQLALGHVFDRNGTPLPYASVTVFAAGYNSSAGRRLATAVADADGRYVATGTARVDGWVDVTAQADGYLASDPVSSPVGANLDFELTLGASVIGEIIADPWLPRSLVVISLHHSDDSVHTRSIAELGGRVFFNGIRAGSVSISVRLRKSDWTVLERDPIPIALGERRVLAPVDLRGLFQPVRLHLTDDDGLPISNVKFRLVDADGNGTSALESSESGELRTLAPGQETQLRLLSKEYKKTLVQLGPETIELTLIENDG